MSQHDSKFKVEAYIDMLLFSETYGHLFIKDSKYGLFKDAGLLPSEMLIKAKEARDANCGK
jgi:hypothetical protein